MRTVDLTPEKQTSEVKTRRIRCLHAPCREYRDKIPSISLAGKWLKKAGFEVGDFACITVLKGKLIIRCEKWEPELQET